MRRDFRAIVVGIEDYDNESWEKLSGVGLTTDRIARALGGKVLALPNGGLKNEAPMRLKAAIDTVPERCTLLIHWIGHGVTAGDQHYLICSDSPAPALLDDFEAFASGALGRILATSRAERIVVILDTCYSGEGAGDLARRYRDNLARQLDREGWERVACIIATAHPLDKAVAGRFSQGLAEALENPEKHLRWTSADQYIDPERLAEATKTLLGQSNKAVYPRFSKEGFGQDIIPNPMFARAEGRADVETARRLEGVFGERAHFNLSARAIETGETGHFFTGRKRSQQEIIEWMLNGQDQLMVVTGPPGSGKSALIGRLVALSVPEARAQTMEAGALHPDDPLPPENAVDVAIHAKGKNVFEVASAIGYAVGLDRTVADQSDIADILSAIAESTDPKIIVIDALDEASAGQASRIANELIRPLSTIPSVRLLIGTRRSLDGGIIPDSEDRHGRLKMALGPEARILDLADELDTRDDIAKYVARRLSSPNGQRGSDEWIAEAIARVADASDGNFLYARLVARSLEALPDAALETLPIDASQAFMMDIASRFSEDAERATDMLRALAFSLGLGLSRAVWAKIATALSKSENNYDDDDIVWMLRNVGSYIIETTVMTDGVGQAVYRLIHQAIADLLKRTYSPNRPHTLIMIALMNGLQGEAWLAADPYIARHLAEHAALANNEPEKAVGFDQLFDHPGFLAAAIPEELVPFLPNALKSTARELRDIYRLAASDLRGAPPAERWALLHRTALYQNSPLAEWLKPGSFTNWTFLWARTQPATPHLAIRGHTDDVTSVALGQITGRLVIVSGSKDHTVRLWDARDGTPIGAPLVGHEDTVRAVAMGQVNSSSVIVSGSRDRTVRLWDARDGTPIGTPLVGHEDTVRSVALGEVNGQSMIVSGSKDGTLRRWDAETGTAIGAPLVGHQAWVTSIAFGHVNGRPLIVSGSQDRTIRLWDAASGTSLGAPLVGHGDWVTSVALGEVGGRMLIVSGSDDRTVRLWDAEAGSAIGAPLVGHNDWAMTVTLGEVGGRVLIVSGSGDRTVRLWDAETGTVIGAPLVGHEAWVTTVALGEVGGRALIVSGSDDRTVRLWDAETSTTVGASAFEQEEMIRAFALGHVNGQLAIVSGGKDRAVRLWDAYDGTPIGVPMVEHDDMVRTIALGQVNGRPIIVSGSKDRTLRRWDAESGTVIGLPLVGHEDTVRAVAMGQVNGRSVIVSGSGDRTVRLWDARDGTPIGTPLVGHEDTVRSVALGEVNGQSMIVSGSKDGTLRRWDAETGTAIGSPLVGHQTRVTSIAFGHVNGRPLIVSGSQDRTIRLWDAASGTSLGAPLVGHGDWVTSVALGEVGGRMLIVSGSDDRTVRLWDATSGDQVITVPLGQGVGMVALAETGQLVVGTSRGIVSLLVRI